MPDDRDTKTRSATPPRRTQALRGLLRGRLPGQLVIQITDACNARCPQCGMRVSERFARSRLSEDACKRILDAAAEKGFQAVSFTGGEPFVDVDVLCRLIRHAGQAGIPYIRTGTNGFLFREPTKAGFEARIHHLADRLAATPLRNLWISIDSAHPPTHERMRGFRGVIDGIEQALPVFHEAGIYPAVNLGINRNLNGEHASGGPARNGDRAPDSPAAFLASVKAGLHRYFQLVLDLGFTMANVCYPMSVEPDAGDADLDAVYAATSLDPVVRFSPREKPLLFRALLETIPAYRSRIRIFSPRSSLHALYKQHAGVAVPPPHPCRGGVDFFFVGATDGNVYPCGYRGGENLGPLEGLDLHDPAPHATCTRCDWECFRDPSELAGPALDLLRAPGTLLRRVARDPGHLRLWAEDLAYYAACGFFNGREPPAYGRLRRFGRSPYVPPPVPVAVQAPPGLRDASHREPARGRTRAGRRSDAGATAHRVRRGKENVPSRLSGEARVAG